VTRTIEYWRETTAVDITVGVHIRSAFHNSGVENGSFLPKHGIFEEIYLPCIERVLRDNPHHRVGIFIAADTAEVREEAWHVLKNSEVKLLESPIKIFPNDTGLSPVRTAEAVVEAAVELFLLAETDYLIVRRSKRFDSTYSAVAASLAKSTAKRIYVSGGRCEPVNVPATPDFHHYVERSCEDWRDLDGQECDNTNSG